MSVFAEPSVTLCGERHDSRYAVCARSVDETGEHRVYGPYTPEQLERAPSLAAATVREGHSWVSVLDVQRALRSTFTPCQWKRCPPGVGPC